LRDVVQFLQNGYNSRRRHRILSEGNDRFARRLHGDEPA
jgi:hypothetical protein